MKSTYNGFLLLAFLLFIANMFDFFLIEILVIILIGAIAIWSQYERIKKLRISQMILIGLFIVGIVLATASLFYYVYRPALELIMIDWIRVISTWLLMIVSLLAVSFLSNSVVKFLATPKNK